MRAGQTDRWPAYAAAGFSPAVDELCARSGLCAAAVCDPATPHTQRFFSEAVDKHCFAALLAAAPQRDKARLLSVSGEGAGAWLGVIPSEALGYVLTPAEFTVLIKWWCGMDVFDAVFACPGCGTAMDKAGYHALSCRHMGSFGVRHNALRDKFLVFLSQAGIPAEREAPSLRPGSAARPVFFFFLSTFLSPTSPPRRRPASTLQSRTPSNRIPFNVRVCVAAQRRRSTR